jgi:hypothetical protein
LADWWAPHFGCYTQVAPARLVACGLCEGAQSLVGMAMCRTVWRNVEWRRRKRRGRETEGEGRAAESKEQGSSTVQPIPQREGPQRAAGNPPGKGAGPCAASPSLANSSHRTAGRCRPLQALFATTPQLAADVQAWRRSTAQRPVAATEKAKTTRGLSKRRCGIRGRPTTSYLVNTDTAKTDDFGHGSRNNQASTADQSPGPPGVRPFAPCRLLHPQSPNADATAQSGSSKHSSQAP